MNLLHSFERIALINLPERRDRLHDSLREFQRIGIRADDPRLTRFAAIRPERAGTFPSIGARGCFMSHLAVLRQARDDGLHSLLVVEDDISFNPRLAHLPDDMTTALTHTRWHFAYPGHIEPLTAAHPEWRHTRSPLICAHCYALHRRVLPPLIDYLEACMARPPGHPDGGPMHIDGAYSMFRARNDNVITLIAAPSLAGQRGSRSDITPNRWYDRAPLSRELATLARRLRHRLTRFPSDSI